MTHESASQLSLEIERQIHQILSSNRVSDLNKFLDKRRSHLQIWKEFKN